MNIKTLIKFALPAIIIGLLGWGIAYALPCPVNVGCSGQSNIPQGSLLYGSSTNQSLNVLPVGASGTVLTIIGSVPGWAVASGGGSGVTTLATGTAGNIFNGSISGSTLTLNLPFASGSNTGQLQSADWTTFNNKVATSRTINTTAPITGGGDLSADRTIACNVSSILQAGCLASADFLNFNNKLSGSLTSGQIVYATGASSTASSNLLTFSTASGLSNTATSTLATTTATTLSVGNIANCTNGVITGTAGILQCNGSAFLTSAVTSVSGAGSVLSSGGNTPTIQLQNLTTNDILFGQGNSTIATSSNLTWDGSKFTTTNASTTNLTVATNFVITGIGTGCATFTAGLISSTGVACGSGGGSSGVGTTTPFTAGFIPEATGTNVTLSNSVISQSADGNIGIGTSTPTAKLLIQGASATNPLSVVSSTGATLFNILPTGEIDVQGPSLIQTLGDGKRIDIKASNGVGNNVAGGIAFLWGGSATQGNAAGGNVGFIAGNGIGTGAGGSGSFLAGQGDGLGTGAGGDLSFFAGDAGGAGGNGGNIKLTPGSQTAGTRGQIEMFADDNTSKFAAFNLANIATSNKTFTFPNETGTFAFSTSSPVIGHCASWADSFTLQDAGSACGSGGSGNSAFTIGSSLIYNATSTDLVGIGTITPLSTLYVQGKGGTNPFTVGSSTGTALLQITQAGQITFGGAQYANIVTGCMLTNGNGTFSKTSTSCLTTGAVAIGQVPYWDSATDLVSSSALLNNGTVAGVNATSSTVNFNIQGTGTNNPFNVASSNAASELTVTSAGNVGIGISTPQKLLHVFGNTANGIALFERSSSGNTGGLTTFLMQADASGTPQNGFGPSFDFYVNNATSTLGNKIGFIQSIIQNNSTTTGGLSFKTINAGSQTNAMDILYNGQVGINTATPEGMLSVKGASGGSVPIFTVASSTTDVFSILANGNINISAVATSSTALLMTNPSAQTVLQVDETAATSGLTIGTTTTASLYSAAQLVVQGNLASSTLPLMLLASSTNTALMTVQPTGHVVYGGTSPSMGTCGSSPSVVGNDTTGTIGVGSGVVTACTLNFANPYKDVRCFESDNSTAVTGDVSATSTTSVTFSFSATLGGGVVQYYCVDGTP